MEHPCLGVEFISPFEVKAGVDPHVACRHEDVLVVGDVYSRGIIHLVICAGGDGEGADGAFAVVEHGVDVRREHRAVKIVDRHGGVGPPEEGLRQLGGVVEFALYLEVCAAGAQGEACHPLLVCHALQLVDPDCHRAVGILLDVGVHRHVGAGAVMLGPVELYASRDPGACESYERRFDDMVVIYEVAPADFVVGHLDASSQFGEHHHLDVFVLQVHRVPLPVMLGVGYRLDYRIGIDGARRSLIDPLFQKHRIFLGCARLIGRYRHLLFPGFYHCSILYAYAFCVCVGLSVLFCQFSLYLLEGLSFGLRKAAAG